MFPFFGCRQHPLSARESALLVHALPFQGLVPWRGETHQKIQFENFTANKCVWQSEVTQEDIRCRNCEILFQGCHKIDNQRTRKGSIKWTVDSLGCALCVLVC